MYSTSQKFLTVFRKIPYPFLQNLLLRTSALLSAITCTAFRGNNQEALYNRYIYINNRFVSFPVFFQLLITDEIVCRVVWIPSKARALRIALVVTPCLFYTATAMIRLR